MHVSNIKSVLFLPTLLFAATGHAACYGPAKHGTLLFSCPNDNITRITFNNPPINLVTEAMIDDLWDFMVHIRPEGNTTDPQFPNGPSPKVVIFDSQNPDFFLGHIDFNFILAPSTDAKIRAPTMYIEVARMIQNITTTAFIAEVNGRAFGAGQELMVQMDMRFAGPKARTGSFENALRLMA